MSQTDLEQIPQPLQDNAEDLVEKVYPVPGTETALDLPSQDEMGAYLISRFEPDPGPRTRVVLEATGRTLPGITRETVGQREVTRWRKKRPLEWLVSPRMAAAVMIGSALFANAIGNRDSIGGAVEAGAHAVYRVFDPVQSHTVTTHHEVAVPGRIVDVNVTASTSDQSGAVTVDPTAIRQFISGLTRVEQGGGIISSIQITGNTSDEWGNDASIGVISPENTQLGQARANAAVNAVLSQDPSLPSSKITVSEKEHVISPAQKEVLTSEAVADGFPSIESAISAVDSRQNVPASLGQKIRQLFTGNRNRGVTMSAVVEHPGAITHKEITTTKTIPGKDHAPKVPEPDFYGFLPMLPIRRRERYTKMKDVKRFRFTASKEIMRPTIIREKADQAWLRLRPEAVNSDGTLIEDAWAYTRKYEHLLRDDRIKEVLRADFSNSEGEEKSLRIMFVDHSPADETVTAFSELLTKFAAMDGGKLAENVRAVFVYPSENAGTAHDDPKRISMGIDKQNSENIMGTYTYILNLIELHMPTSWSADDLERALAAFNGPSWVLSHEASHGVDKSNQPLRLRRVSARNIPNAHVIDGDPRAHRMSPLQSVLAKLPRRAADKHQPIEYDIAYPVVDNNGQVVTMQARVQEDDPRLTHATHAAIVGYQPTVYSSENEAEHFAETGAAVTTGIDVPFEEASVPVRRLRTDDGQPAEFATGYRPDARAQELFTEAVGGQSGEYPLSFVSPSPVTIQRLNPAEDPLLRRELIRTRQVRTLTPRQMVAILARVIQRKGTPKL